MAVGGIGLEAPAGIGNPYLAIIGITDPSAIGTQRFIKYIK
jgi:hypothetical protein